MVLMTMGAHAQEKGALDSLNNIVAKASHDTSIAAAYLSLSRMANLMI